MTTKKTIVQSILAIIIIFSLSLSNHTPTQAAPSVRTDAVVLVNSDSPNYADFQHFIQPYLDNFGIPYTVLNIATTAVGSNIGDYAVIIIGHRSLDVGNLYLDSTEQANITSAVSAGTGLVNFDNNLGSGGAGIYSFIQSIFNFTYTTPAAGSGVRFDIPQQPGVQINLWENSHQDPNLPTTTNAGNLIPNDNQWTEYLDAVRGYPGIFGGVDETLPTLHFFGAVPNGGYTLVAQLYWNDNLRYYWGYTSNDPKANTFEVNDGVAGDFSYYALGTVTITNGQFDLYVQDADPTYGGNEYPFYGWASVRLVPIGTPPPASNYIIERHPIYGAISTGNMLMGGITLGAGDTGLAWTGDQPFLAVTNHDQGRAVQWGTYDWTSNSIKGTGYGLDDLVWRSIVWSARKPFVMQGMPPFVTMRVDDVSGILWWLNTATDLGFKPWLGLFYQEITATEAATISAFVNAGQATASVHAKTSTSFFYYDHDQTLDFSDPVMAANYAEATAFHTTYNIPISKYVVPHYYEIGTNAFQGLKDWGVEFIGTHMVPGNPYGAPWLNAGPYRLFGTGTSSDTHPAYYADYFAIPSHPGFNNQFFDCVTEIRDDEGYEWYPDGGVYGTVDRGQRQTKRALNNMMVATLFTHEYFFQWIDPNAWRASLEAIKTILEPYGPIYVTMDYACQYVRAVHNSNITASSYDPDLYRLTTTLTGTTDLMTRFYLFTETGNTIYSTMVDVPVFSGTTTVNFVISPTAISLRTFSANNAGGGLPILLAIGLAGLLLLLYMVFKSWARGIK